MPGTSKEKASRRFPSKDCPGLGDPNTLKKYMFFDFIFHFFVFVGKKLVIETNLFLFFLIWGKTGLLDPSKYLFLEFGLL